MVIIRLSSVITQGITRRNGTAMGKHPRLMRPREGFGFGGWMVDLFHPIFV